MTVKSFVQHGVAIPTVRNGTPELSYKSNSTAPCFGKDGQVVGLLNQGVEVAEQVRAAEALRGNRRAVLDLSAGLEQALAQRAAERDRVWATSPDLTQVIGFEGHSRFGNPARAVLLGYEPGELVGHRVNEFLLPGNPDKTVRAYMEAAGGGRPRVINRYRHKDGSARRVSWTAASAANLNNAVGRDITDEWQREPCSAEHGSRVLRTAAAWRYHTHVSGR